MAWLIVISNYVDSIYKHKYDPGLSDQRTRIYRNHDDALLHLQSVLLQLFKEYIKEYLLRHTLDELNKNKKYNGWEKFISYDIHKNHDAININENLIMTQEEIDEFIERYFKGEFVEYIISYSLTCKIFN
jgi:hypothetical protein